jgi:pyruvate dehydrogenase E1 component beta subunit
LYHISLSPFFCNTRTLRPLDRDAIVATAKKTGRVVSVEEGWSQCGIGAEIAATLMETEAFDYLDAPMERITGADVPMPYSIPLEELSAKSCKVIIVIIVVD